MVATVLDSEDEWLRRHGGLGVPGLLSTVTGAERVGDPGHWVPWPVVDARFGPRSEGEGVRALVAHTRAPQLLQTTFKQP